MIPNESFTDGKNQRDKPQGYRFFAAERANQNTISQNQTKIIWSKPRKKDGNTKMFFKAEISEKNNRSRLDQPTDPSIVRLYQLGNPWSAQNKLYIYKYKIIWINTSSGQ